MSNVLQDNVLVLNRVWQAVNFCSVARALTLLVCGHAQVVTPSTGGGFETHGFEDWVKYCPPTDSEPCVHTTRLRIKTPRIILLSLFDRFPKKDVKFTRLNVFERDGFACQYCGRTRAEAPLNIDHVVPRQLGGKTTWVNVVCSCVACNARKANRTPEQAGMRLRSTPVKPRWRPFIEVKLGRAFDESWNSFLQPGMVRVSGAGRSQVVLT